MANRDLLTEAIADAKAVKEMAIANAKAALEEAFEPRLKSMLSAKLEEMEKEEVEEEEIEEVVTNEAKEEVEEADEMDLDEILAELEKDEESEDIKEEVTEAEEEAEMEDEAEDVDMEGEDEDEEIDLEDMSEEDLKSFIEDVIADMVEAGELEAGEEFEAEEDEDAEGEEIDIEADEEEIMEGKEEDMEEALGTINDPDGPEARGNLSEDDKEAWWDKNKSFMQNMFGVDNLKDLMAALGDSATAGMTRSGSGKTSSIGEAELEDMMEEVNSLRAELNEVNLLNAKLLYANKIFRAKNLKEAQKVKVLEAFDKAETVKEVKLVFETLSSEVKETKTIVKESLGSASKPAGMSTKKPIVEVDAQVARWQKLAGIK
jgi:hypothetical protein